MTIEETQQVIADLKEVKFQILFVTKRIDDIIELVGDQPLVVERLKELKVLLK